MPVAPPDFRARRVLADAGWDPADPRESALRELVTTGEMLISEVADAYALYTEPAFRHVVDALLIAKATDVEVASALDVEPRVLNPYRHLFFDRTVFRNALEVHAYVAAQAEDVRDACYLVATRQGVATLADRFRIGRAPDLDPKQVLREILTDLHARFTEHRGEVLTSALAQAALRLAPEVIKAAALVNEKGGSHASAAVSALKLALDLKDETAEQPALPIGEIAGL